MTPRAFLVVLRGRWRLLLAVFLVVAGSAVAVGLLLPGKYKATTQIVIDVKPDVCPQATRS